MHEHIEESHILFKRLTLAELFHKVTGSLDRTHVKVSTNGLRNKIDGKNIYGALKADPVSLNPCECSITSWDVNKKKRRLHGT